MKKTKKILLFVAIVLTIVFVASIIANSVMMFQFKTNCEQYIKRAAEASNVETAKEELAKAVHYAESNNLTEGNTGVFFNQPKNDVGYWYKNMKQAYDELNKLPEDATQLEESNLLMRVRETLVFDGKLNVQVTHPENIHLYPNVVAFVIWMLGSGIICLILWVILLGMA